MINNNKYFKVFGHNKLSIYNKKEQIPKNINHKHNLNNKN